MGVWIETMRICICHEARQSHPVWVCGLKHHKETGKAWADLVTPCMGVWIETRSSLPSGCGLTVTPCMGVWIETSSCP